MGQNNSQHSLKNNKPSKNDSIKSKETLKTNRSTSIIYKKGLNIYFNGIVLEEFKALKQESLRLNQDIATIIWIGLSGFIATIGASLVFFNSYNNIGDSLPWIILILCLQSFAASAMFSFEIQRYARVGKYIRIKIEKSFFSKDNSDLFKKPLYWEHWIYNKHSTWFYIISTIILQLPIIITLSLLLPEKLLSVIAPSLFKNSSPFSSLVKLLHQYKFEFWIFLLIIVEDIAMMTYMYFEIKHELEDDKLDGE